MNVEDRELEACTWIAKIDGGEFDSNDLQNLRNWIEEHPDNKAAFEQFSSDFISVRDLLSTVGEAVHDLEDSANKSGTFAGLVKSAQRNWGMMATGGAIAASLIWATLLFGSVDLSLVPATDINKTPIFYASKIGEKETVILADGSSVTLNTNTHLAVEYTPYERRVQLMQGEAVFNVAKDANRPFRVHTNRTVVQAIGTIFSVKSMNGKVELLVEEGIVELTANAVAEHTKEIDKSKLSEKKRVSSGGYSVFESKTDTLVHVKDEALVQRRMSWRSGMLTFDNDPLSEIVKEYNRYIEQKIVIDDPSLLALPIGGAFPIGQTDALLDALAQGFGVKTEYRDDQTIHLVRAN